MAFFRTEQRTSENTALERRPDRGAVVVLGEHVRKLNLEPEAERQRSKSMTELLHSLTSRDEASSTAEEPVSHLSIFRDK